VQPFHRAPRGDRADRAQPGARAVPPAVRGVAPLILLSSDDTATLPLAVVNMRVASHGAIDYSALEAGVMFMAVPCLVLFLFLQRSYVRGFMTGTLRG